MGAKALYGFDMRPGMKDCKARGMFVVGKSDEILQEDMEKFAERLGDEGASFAKAGHLPMVENPMGFLDVVEAFLVPQDK